MKIGGDLLTLVLIWRSDWFGVLCLFYLLEYRSLTEMFTVRNHKKGWKVTVTLWKIIVISNATTAQLDYT